jgi:hypothetical protein
MTRSIVGSTLVLVGVALFVFYFFGFSVSSSDGTPLGQGWRLVGWHGEAGYDVHARLGLAVGAILVVAGVFLRKATK